MAETFDADGDVRCAGCGVFEDPQYMSTVAGALYCVSSFCAAIAALEAVANYRRASDFEVEEAIRECETALSLLKVERDSRAARVSMRAAVSDMRKAVAALGEAR